MHNPDKNAVLLCEMDLLYRSETARSIPLPKSTFRAFLSGRMNEIRSRISQAGAFNDKVFNEKYHGNFLAPKNPGITSHSQYACILAVASGPWIVLGATKFHDFFLLRSPSKLPTDGQDGQY